MKFETRFPKGFPEVGDVIRFTCRERKKQAINKSKAATQDADGINSSTVEVLVIGRSFDEATGLHYLTTSDDVFKHICNCGGWESEGWIPTDDRGPKDLRFEEYRTKIHELKVVRKHR